jgi:hypothetical protein
VANLTENHKTISMPGALPSIMPGQTWRDTGHKGLMPGVRAGDFYVGKTEGQSSSSSAVPWLSEAVSQGAHHMKTTVKGRKSTKTKRLRLQFHMHE